ncbi:SHOCT domain-containing protein [Clostridium neuense]|uniref:SHOCT domain-containing protein n=1 Tax=Clostridium neuense TaxID=1728934 RepID=A0ABW8TGA7_9CLOT
MGFFSLKATCAICNEEVGLNRFQIANKEWICPKCFKKCGFNALTPIRKMTVSEIKNAMAAKATNDEEINLFNASKKIGSYIEFDDTRMEWLVPEGLFGKKKKIYKYNDIVDYELLEDGESIIKKSGIGRAVAGGVLFGGVGAVVGSVTGKQRTKSICKSLKLKITISDINNPTVYIDFIPSETKKDSWIYKNAYNSAQECLSVLQLICSNSKNEMQNNAAPISNADEILKYKNLLDNGIITQEEFEAKKKQLLDI